MRDVRLQYAGGAAANGISHLIRITRMRDGRADILDANETTPVEPGDVIEVKNEMQDVLSYDESSASHPTVRPSKTEARQVGETGISQ
jgi:polysaccharide export outer membrane protein